MSSEVRRILIVSAAVCAIYVLAGLRWGGLRGPSMVAAGAAAITGLIASVGTRWSLFVLGALLLGGLAAVVVVAAFAFFASAGEFLSTRLVTVAQLVGVCSPLLGLQVWAFSAAARRAHGRTNGQT